MSVSRRPKILVVEDYAPTREIISAALTGSFMETVSVCDGREALVYLAGDRPDLVLTDFIMPNLDGVSLAREIRRRPDLLDLPVVFLTGADSYALRHQCRELGVADVLEKPFVAADLIDRLKGILAQSRVGPELELYHGWAYAPLHRVELPFADPTVRDRLELPFHPSELGRTGIVKRPTRLLEVARPASDIKIARSISSWDYLPPGASIPDFAAAGRTAVELPDELIPPGPLVRRAPRRAQRARRVREAPAQWVQANIGACRLFDVETLELGRTVERALRVLEAA